MKNVKCSDEFILRFISVSGAELIVDYNECIFLTLIVASVSNKG